MFIHSLRAFCLLVILCISSPVLAQSADNSAENAQNQAISLSEDPNSVSLSSSGMDQLPANGGSPSTLGLIVRMFFVLAVVLALVYVVMRMMRKAIGTPDTDDPFLRKVSQVTLAPGKTVQIVTILDHAYVVGVSDNSVNLLGEISDKELVDSMNILADKNAKTKKPMSFPDLLDLFVGKNSSKNTSFSDFSKNAADSLKQQRENFNNRGN